MDGDVLSKSDADFLDKATTRAHIDADVVFAVEDPRYQGAKSSKIPIGAIRDERPRVLAEIAKAAPECVIVLGPVAAKCVLDKGNSPPIADMRRQKHEIANIPCPVYFTYSLEEASFKQGLLRWINIDLMNIGLGTAKSIMPVYPVQKEPHAEIVEYLKGFGIVL